MIYLLTLFSLLPLPTHDAVLALFRVSEAETGLVLDLSFDQEDFASVTNIPVGTLDGPALQAYLDQTIVLHINDQKVEVLVQTVRTKEDHYRANCRIVSASRKVQNLQLHNEFLLPLADHSNILMLDLNGRSRDFRMHSGRRELAVRW